METKYRLVMNLRKTSHVLFLFEETQGLFRSLLTEAQTLDMHQLRDISI